jgi:hypothetical protein
MDYKPHSPNNYMYVHMCIRVHVKYIFFNLELNVFRDSGNNEHIYVGPNPEIPSI